MRVRAGTGARVAANGAAKRAHARAFLDLISERATAAVANANRELAESPLPPPPPSSSSSSTSRRDRRMAQQRALAVAAAAGIIAAAATHVYEPASVAR